MVICAVFKCTNRSGRDKVSFFSFPRDNSKVYDDFKERVRCRRKMWLLRLKRADLVCEDKIDRSKVCSKHFISGKPSHLNDITNPDWAPSLLLGYDLNVANDEIGMDSAREFNDIAQNGCFIPGCETKYEREENEEISTRKKVNLFKPLNMHQLEKWSILIPSKGKELTMNDSVCELHFSEMDIVKDIKTSSVRLKDGALPIIFSSMPDAVDDEKSSPVPRKKIKQESVLNLSDSDSELEPLIEILTYEDLIQNLKYVMKPHMFWAITDHEEFVMCARWSVPLLHYKLQKRVVIDRDLRAKVFLEDWEMPLANDKISHITILSDLLHKVESVDTNCIHQKKYMKSFGFLWDSDPYDSDSSSS